MKCKFLLISGENSCLRKFMLANVILIVGFIANMYGLKKIMLTYPSLTLGAP